MLEMEMEVETAGPATGLGRGGTDGIISLRQVLGSAIWGFSASTESRCSNSVHVRCTAAKTGGLFTVPM